jgi:hypothetical protein
VNFFEAVSDGDMVAEGLSDLSPDLRNEIRSDLLPDVTRTASLNILSQLGVELVFADTEERAAEQVSRICSSAGMLGLDVETAPRSEFLPVCWPIAITRDGKRSKVQAAMDTSAALDPYRAEFAYFR